MAVCAVGHLLADMGPKTGFTRDPNCGGCSLNARKRPLPAKLVVSMIQRAVSRVGEQRDAKRQAPLGRGWRKAIDGQEHERAFAAAEIATLLDLERVYGEANPCIPT
jgi:hypothetical protein